jgi:hypothetical protein
MNIDELTLGQIKEIQNFLQVEKTSSDHPLKDKYVICRCCSAGVHAGYLVSKNGDEVMLKNSRRLWTWGSDGGVALSGVAQLGLSSGKKIDVINPLIELNGVIETILCSKKSEDSINNYV